MNLLPFLLGLLMAPQCLKLDIVLVGDFSQSVTGHERFVADAFEAFADNLELSEEDCKIGVVMFDDKVIFKAPLTSDKTTLRKALQVVRATSVDQNSTTDFFPPMKAASEELWGNGRLKTRKVIILVSDGLHNGPVGIEDLGLAIQKTGVLISTVLIKTPEGSNSTLMYNLATPGLYVESSYGTLVNQLKKLNLCW